MWAEDGVFFPAVCHEMDAGFQTDYHPRLALIIKGGVKQDLVKTAQKDLSGSVKTCSMIFFKNEVLGFINSF